MRTSTSDTLPLRLGYGTNGLTDLRLEDALALLADLGYDGVGLTLDHMHLDPLAPDLAARTAKLAARLAELGLAVTVETGARYVLDPRRKHGPSLLDPEPEDRGRRVALLLRAVRVAAELGAHAVHCFSGVIPPGTDEEAAWMRLAEALNPVLAAAEASRVALAIEPEPGHLLADLAGFHRLRRLLGDPRPLGLTLDIGHCQCLESLSPAECVREAAPWLRHVQIEDMRRGVHEHLPFGEGEIDFPPVLAALAAADYRGLTVVELPRHSHAGPRYAEHSLSFLHRAATTAGVATTARATTAARSTTAARAATASSAATAPSVPTTAAPAETRPSATAGPLAETRPSATAGPLAETRSSAATGALAETSPLATTDAPATTLPSATPTATEGSTHDRRP